MFQLVFFYDIILLIKHTVYWGLIHQQKQMKINKEIFTKIVKY